MSWYKPQFLFKTDRAPNLKEFIGRMVTIPEFAHLDGKRVKISEERVKIQTIVGNRFHPAFFEINGKYRIGMLRFFAQMENDHSITEDQFQAFEETELKAERMPDESKEKDGSRTGSEAPASH